VTSEDRFLDKLRALLPDDERLLLPPGDDAAVVRCAGGLVAATTDTMVEGVDFLSGQDPETLGRRALAINLSDLAAIGAAPEFFLLSLAFPPERGEDWALAVCRGALSRARSCGALLAGGDLSSAPLAMISVALWGRPPRRVITRSGGRPGDRLYVTGYPGRAAAGLRLARALDAFASRGSLPVERFVGISPAHQQELLAAYRDPEPRLAAGSALAQREIATAAIDVSDGLGIDAGRLAKASGVRAVLEGARLPVAPSLAALAEISALDPRDWVLAGGDDYELLLSAPPDREAEVLALDVGVPIVRIGHLEEGAGAILRDRRGEQDVTAMGYDHGIR
jgi:thiamine-monophosphate kinase